MHSGGLISGPGPHSTTLATAMAGIGGDSGGPVFNSLLLRLHLVLLNLTPRPSALMPCKPCQATRASPAPLLSMERPCNIPDFFRNVVSQKCRIFKIFFVRVLIDRFKPKTVFTFLGIPSKIKFNQTKDYLLIVIWFAVIWIYLNLPCFRFIRLFLFELSGVQIWMGHSYLNSNANLPNPANPVCYPSF